MKNITAYKKILDLFLRMVDVNKGVKIKNGEFSKEIELLAIKFIQHCLSIYSLSKGTVLRKFSYNINFIDIASINVLVRSAYENFLTFYFIFIDSGDEEERNYKYLCWKLDGILERQSYTILTKLAKDISVSDMKEAKQLKTKIQSNSYHKRLPAKQKRRLENGYWKDCWRLGKSWKKIGSRTEFSSDYATSLYSHLSGFTHSSSMSLANLNNLKKGEKPEATLGFMLIIMSNFIHSYKSLFLKSDEVYKNDRAIDGDVNNNPIFKKKDKKFEDVAHGATLSEIWIDIGKKKLKKYSKQ